LSNEEKEEEEEEKRALSLSGRHISHIAPEVSLSLFFSEASE
jgi:hypothetical protein